MRPAQTVAASRRRSGTVAVVIMLGATSVAGCAHTGRQPARKGKLVAHPTTSHIRRTLGVVHNFREIARLQATREQYPVYVDDGPATGSINMAMSLVFNDDTGKGKYMGLASNGAIFGEVVASTFSDVGFGYDLTGHVTVTSGTGAYVHATARKLAMHGEIMFGGRFTIDMAGPLYY